MFLKMFLMIVLFIFHVCYCDWVSEWMSPMQNEFKSNPARRINNDGLKIIENDEMKMVPVIQESQDHSSGLSNPNLVYRVSNSKLSISNLKNKLEDTLQNAKMLEETLKTHIMRVTAKENTLKDAIANGIAGVSVVTAFTSGQQPRTYLIRDGLWTVCNGVVQSPAGLSPTNNLFNELFSTPRCIGQEVSTFRDPCVFNSVIKYETIPTRRASEYSEDDYLCLKTAFNTTLEQYLSVPLKIINETCTNGIVRSLENNMLQCGIRIMVDYTYYPHRSTLAAVLPLEYCTEKDGSCKLITAWHISNATIENFEFLKNEQNFKKYFLKPY